MPPLRVEHNLCLFCTVHYLLSTDEYSSSLIAVGTNLLACKRFVDGKQAS